MYYDLYATQNPFIYEVYYCAGEDEDWDPIATITKETNGWWAIKDLKGNTMSVQKFLLDAFRGFFMDCNYDLRIFNGEEMVATSIIQ